MQPKSQRPSTARTAGSAFEVSGKANVIFCVHHVSFADLDPNESRDRELDKETNSLLPKARSDAMAAQFNKYRTFVGDEIYIPVD